MPFKTVRTTGLALALGVGLGGPAGAANLPISWGGGTGFVILGIGGTTGFSFAPQSNVFAFTGANNDGASYFEGAINLQVHDAGSGSWVTISTASGSGRFDLFSTGSFGPLTIDGLRFEGGNSFTNVYAQTTAVFSFDQRIPISVPEPAAMTLLLTALGVAGLAWRRGAPAAT